jgi:hypothetical protein
MVVVATLLAAPLFGQIHLKATPQAKGDTDVYFGRLLDHAAYSVDLCSNYAAPVKVQAARIRQSVKVPDGYAILSQQVASVIVQDAQGKAPLQTAQRITQGVVGVGAGAVAIKAVQGNAASDVILGLEAASLVVQFIFPALQTHAVQAIGTQMLPEDLSLDSLGCVSGLVIVSVPRKVKALAVIEDDVDVK